MVVVQLWGIDVFEFPDALKVDDPPKTDAGKPMVAIGKIISSQLKPELSRWTAAAIVPYTPPYPHTPRQLPSQDRTISVLIRERLNANENIIHHEQIRLSPDFPPPSAPLNVEEHDEEPHAEVVYDFHWYLPDSLLDRFLTKSDTIQFTKIQARSGTRPHFFHDIVVAPASGHGFWIENITSALDRQSNEKLMLFSAVRNTKEYPEDDPLIDIGGVSAEPAHFRELDATSNNRQQGAGTGRDEMKPQREGTVRWCLQHTPAVMRSSSYCSFDDSVGRIVIATHDGKVRVVDLGSAAT